MAHTFSAFVVHPITPPSSTWTHHVTCTTILSSRYKSHAQSRRAVLRVLSLFPLSLLPQPIQSRCLPPHTAQFALSESFPDVWPYTTYDFTRYDKLPDAQFYAEPRITRHIDNPAVEALKAYYATELLPSAVDILDMCTSVESYITPTEKFRVSGLGMNEVEMRRNPALSSFTLHDLNVDPRLPYRNESFDLVLCALSIDYLTRPREVLQQVCRVLRPGGRVAVSFSNRVFPTKAVALWMSGGDLDHIYTVASFIHFAGGFSSSQVVDLSPRRRGVCLGDPLYIVTTTKLQLPTSFVSD